jgi:hypothetical protein
MAYQHENRFLVLLGGKSECHLRTSLLLWAINLKLPTRERAEWSVRFAPTVRAEEEEGG